MSGKCPAMDTSETCGMAFMAPLQCNLRDFAVHPW